MTDHIIIHLPAAPLAGGDRPYCCNIAAFEDTSVGGRPMAAAARGGVLC